MAEPKFSMTADDDLPRTLRREKEAREREALEASLQPAGDPRAGSRASAADKDYGYDGEDYESETVSVRYLDIPFFHLMLFFIKAVFAAIPALIILGAILYGMGQVLKAYFPWLIQAEILLRIPNG